MATVGKAIKVYSNPQRKSTSRRKRKAATHGHKPRAKARKRSNTNVAKAKRRKKNPMPSGLKRYWASKRAGRKTKAKGRKRNTAVVVMPGGHRAATGYAGNPRRKRRKNPEGLRAILGSPKSLLVQGVAGLTSAVATRQLPQIVLGASNFGLKGYGANILTGAAATWAAVSFVGPEAGKAALVGALVIILDRVLTEKVSPVGKYLSLAGVGDATAATRLGTIAEGYYIHPTVYDAAGNPIIPHEVTDQALAQFRASQPQQRQQGGQLQGAPSYRAAYGPRFAA
jgi:hypothetical protein